jgi:hypothetical protein
MSEEEFNALWADFVKRAHKAHKPPLSVEERCFYIVNLLRGSVPRSGFIGYFENFRPQDVAAAHEALRALRLPSVLSLLEKAQNAVLADRPLPEDSSVIVVFPDSLTEEEYEKESIRLDAALNPLEADFYKHDDEIWSALCDYADRHHLQPRANQGPKPTAPGGRGSS